MGDIEALKIYKELLQITRNALVGVIDVSRLLFYSDNIKMDDSWPNDEYQKHLQSNGDLGSRIKDAFRHAFLYFDQAIIIGSDCPYITHELIDEAFRKLIDYDIVIGPTHDGGYYLLGMNNLHSSLFQDISWSTSSVYPQTVSKVLDLGLNYWEGPTLSDIDYEEDWKAYLDNK